MRPAREIQPLYEDQVNRRLRPRLHWRAPKRRPPPPHYDQLQTAAPALAVPAVRAVGAVRGVPALPAVPVATALSRDSPFYSLSGICVAGCVGAVMLFLHVASVHFRFKSHISFSVATCIATPRAWLKNTVTYFQPTARHVWLTTQACLVERSKSSPVGVAWQARRVGNIRQACLHGQTNRSASFDFTACLAKHPTFHSA